MAILKLKFRYSKYLIHINNIDTDKIIISNKVCFKSFIGYKDDEKVKSLLIMLLKMSGYA